MTGDGDNLPQRSRSALDLFERANITLHSVLGPEVFRPPVYAIAERARIRGKFLHVISPWNASTCWNELVLVPRIACGSLRRGFRDHLEATAGGPI